ncbi:FixH family protein [Rhizobiales bacterium]|uniref:FixH family protein n=1 Tax=Hongsoonwoonella zoysiae TaxID=2821844 RepID=UPI00155F9E7D|nr:FixH family protein [Hongsoonwoonella zoysiae]NRG19566.1 FixH family protein [Hongsoonwoonella zoysiae]
MQASTAPGLKNKERRVTGRTVLIWLCGFFGAIFAANAVFIWLALGSFPGVAVESSYKAGLTYNEEIAASKEQAKRHWGVEANVKRRADGTADIGILARDEAGSPLSGLAFTATFIRPASAQAYRTVTLSEGESGSYTGIASGVSEGRWILELEAEGADGVVFRSRNRMFLSAE